MKFKLIISLLLLFNCAIGFAQNESQTHDIEIGAETDDDSYLLQGQDKYYTAGQFIYYRQALSVSDNSKLQNKVLGFEIGQKIWNPQSGSVANANGVDQPSLVDRPFAAYLYIGSTLNFLYKDESNLVLSAQLGVVGPNAFGMQVQDFVHDNFGFYHPSGWEYQINNDYEVNLSATYNKLLARATSFDFSLASYADLGLGFTGAGIGPMFRLGNFNQLFNSVSTQSTVSKKKDIPAFHKHELFFYYKPMINYVAYDATIQGGLFDNHSGQEITKDKEPFVVSQEAGIGLTANHFVFNIAVIFHSVDAKEMAASDQWGAITGFYRFK